MTQTELICHETRVPLPVSACLSPTGISRCRRVSTGQRWMWLSFDIMIYLNRQPFSNTNNMGLPSSFGFPPKNRTLSAFVYILYAVLYTLYLDGHEWEPVCLCPSPHFLFTSYPTRMHIPSIAAFTVHNSKHCVLRAGTRSNSYKIKHRWKSGRASSEKICVFVGGNATESSWP